MICVSGVLTIFHVAVPYIKMELKLQLWCSCSFPDLILSLVSNWMKNYVLNWMFCHLSKYWRLRKSGKINTQHFCNPLYRSGSWADHSNLPSQVVVYGLRNAVIGRNLWALVSRGMNLPNYWEILWVIWTDKGKSGSNKDNVTSDSTVLLW